MIKAIKTTKEHKAALKRIAVLMEKKFPANSDEYAELELLSILVDEYESRTFPIDMPDPVEAIKFRLEQMGLDVSAFAEIIGSKSRASEILNHKRTLSLSMIRILQKKLSIPAEILIAEYPRSKTA